ncbi:hypothetical protein J2D73_18175, partial [Acetobacter sacchari]
MKAIHRSVFFEGIYLSRKRIFASENTRASGKTASADKKFLVLLSKSRSRLANCKSLFGKSRVSISAHEIGA